MKLILEETHRADRYRGLASQLFFSQMILDNRQLIAIMPNMAKKQEMSEPISAAVRSAIENSGRTRYEIAKASGVEQSALSRFMSGQRGLTTTSLDKLALLLGLRIVSKRSKRS